VDLHPGGFVAQVEVRHQRRRVERAGIDHLARGDHLHVDQRLALREVGKPRHQPARREHRRRGDLQVGLGGALADRLYRRCERVEALAQARQRRARRLGELHAAPGAAEQFHAQVFLERLDLVADGGLRDGKLVRRLLERQVARGGLEYPQRVQGRQAINHGTSEFFLCKK